MPYQRLTQAERFNRLQQWINLRLTGHSYDAIAAQYGVNKTTVHEQVTNALRERANQSIDTLRDELVSQYDLVIESMSKQVKLGDHQAAGAVIKALTQKAQLLGANAVSKSQLEVIQTGSIDEQIEALTQQLEETHALPAAPVMKEIER